MTFLPIVERELRVAARKPGTYWLRFVAALVVMVMVMLVLWGSGRNSRPAQVAAEIFDTMSVLAMVFCLSTGVFLTADCLSEEKREGTAGLLFLTDLKGYDVVLGKLAANSIHACYGLMSIFPMLALTFLMGGVSGGQFWRMVLVLIGTLFFSLSAGMAVSAGSRESRQATVATLALILLLAGIFPALNSLLTGLWRPGPRLAPLLWPSPGYACLRAFDTFYRYGRGGAYEFWGSLGTIAGLGIVFLALASAVLPRAWQEKRQAGPVAKGRGFLARLRYGTVRSRQLIRLRLLSANPFYWLAVRDRLPQIGSRLLIGMVILLWTAFYLGVALAPSTTFTADDAFEISIYITLGATLIFKFMVAIEASRRFAGDRQSGALELLLVTPMNVQQIIAGQRRALRAQFRLPTVALILLYIALLWLSWANRLGISRDTTSMMIFCGDIVVLLADLWALTWVGMWCGLRARRQHRAGLSALLRILLPPWIALVVAVTALEFFFGRREKLFFSSWFVFGVVNDLFWALRARRGLRREFRLRAAETVAIGWNFRRKLAGVRVFEGSRHEVLLSR